MHNLSVPSISLRVPCPKQPAFRCQPHLLELRIVTVTGSNRGVLETCAFLAGPPECQMFWRGQDTYNGHNLPLRLEEGQLICQNNRKHILSRSGGSVLVLNLAKVSYIY